MNQINARRDKMRKMARESRKKEDKKRHLGKLKVKIIKHDS
jgi:hypothetical protein